MVDLSNTNGFVSKAQFVGMANRVASWIAIKGGLLNGNS